MYIKSVKMTGFRSYKEETLVEFSRRHNVVVGKNGSGKSNVFKALEFILSNQYRTVASRDFQKYVYEGSERRVYASVEVVFDNTSQQIPLPTEEVIIRRIFGSKKDQWSLNNKNTNKEDVTSLLESAGLSRTNPYYIVAQGQVTTLIKMKDENRLQLVKDIAGTRVYDDRRKESMKIMKETERKRDQIAEIMEYFNNRLTELEEEQEELREYQQIDRKRRAIQLTLYRNNVAAAEKRKAKLEKISSNNVDLEEVYETLNDKKEEREKLTKQVKDIEIENGAQIKEQDRLTKERRKANKILQKAKLAMEATGEKIQQQNNRKREIEKTLKNLEDQIDKTETRLNDELRPLFEEKVSVEETCANKLTDLENRRDDLYSKQHRSSAYATKEDRDANLREIIDGESQTLSANKEQVDNLKSKLSQAQNQMDNQMSIIKDGEERQETLKEKLSEIKDRHNDLKKEKEKRQGLRKKAQKELQELKKKLKSAKSDLKKAEDKLRSTMPRKMYEAYKNTKRIIDSYGIDGVYGPVLELFNVDSNFEKCVEIVAHNRLMNWVVRDDNVATRVVEALQQQKGGRVTLMPLNRLYFNQKKGPNSNNAFWMTDKLEYEPRVDLAMKQVFGNWLICRDLQTAQQFSEQYDVDATNLDGDTVNRRGAITGGYYDSKRVARISAMREIKNLKREITNMEQSIRQKKDKIGVRNQEMSTLLGNIQKVEGERSNVRTEQSTVTEQVTSAKTNQRTYQTLIEETERNMRKQQHDIQRLEQRIETLREELSAPFNKTLTDEEIGQLDTLADEIEIAREKLQAASREKMQIQGETTALENELNENLLKQQDDLSKQLADMNDDELAENQEKHEQDMSAAKQNQDELDSKIASLESQNENALSRQQEANKRIETLVKEIGKLEKKLSEANQKTQSAFKTIKSLEETIQSENEKIRKLGTLPDQEYIEMYVDLSRKKLEQNLKRENRKLQAFQNVNKKALDQYEHFTQQRDQLLKRQKDQEKSKKAIQDLIDHLDRQKDEAIQRTYKAIAINFSKVFSELVEGGTGKFVMFKRQEENDDDEDDEKMGEERSSSDNYTGIGIRVSFTGGRDDLYSMTQLSGGQQTVVALSLIFAIQRCDPSPFYLFDEIDAALDAVHRQSVAQMVHKHSDQSQFITTTFRPEMLQTADKFIGVYYMNKISVASEIDQDEAQTIIASEGIDEEEAEENAI